MIDVCHQRLHARRSTRPAALKTLAMVPPTRVPAALALVAAFALTGCSHDPPPVEIESREATPRAAPEAHSGELDGPPSAPARSSASEAATGRVVEDVPLDASRPLEGRIVPIGAFPPDASLSVFLEVRAGANGESGRGTPIDRPWIEVARAPVGPDLRFALPRPTEHDHAVVRIDGTHLTGVSTLLDPTDEDDGDRPVEVAGHVGALVTLQLVAPDRSRSGVTPEAALRGLAGREVVVRGHSSTVTGPMIERTVTFGPDGRSEPLRGLLPGRFELTGAGPEGLEGALAPYLVRSTFALDVRAGQTEEFAVPLVVPRRLAGCVVDEAGEPVGDARIACGAPGAEIRHASTNSGGAFAIDAIADDIALVTVRARGHLTMRLEDGEANALVDRDDLVLTLARGATVAVRVTGPGGAPSPGLVVLADVEERERDAMPTGLGRSRARQVRQRSTTDDEGIARFHALPPEPVRIRCAAIETPAGGGATGERATRLGPLTGPDDMPVALDAGDGSLWCAEASVTPTAGDALVSLALRPAPEIRGIVRGVDVTGVEPALVAIRLDLPRRNGRRQVMGSAIFRVDRGTGAFRGQAAAGSYVLAAVEGVRPGQSTLVAPALLGGEATAEFELTDAGVEVELRLRSETPLRGVVVRPDGTPIAGLDVTVMTMASIGNREGRTVTTDASGRFEVRGLPAGHPRVTVADPRFAIVSGGAMQLGARDSDEPLRIVATPAGAVRVTVIGADGTPREGAQCEIWQGARRQYEARRLEEPTAWEGAYGPLAPGTYAVKVDAQQTAGRRRETFVLRVDRTPEPPRGASAPRIEEFEIHAGQVTEVTVLESARGTATVTGSVLSGGEPVAGLTVELLVGSVVASRARTDAGGRFDLSVAEVGDALVRFGDRMDRLGIERSVVLRPGENRLPPIHLSTGAIVVHAFESTAGSSADVPDMVLLRRRGGGSTARAARPDDDGTCRFDRVPDGEYDLHRTSSRLTATVTVTNGGTVEVEEGDWSER